MVGTDEARTIVDVLRERRGSAAGLTFVARDGATEHLPYPDLTDAASRWAGALRANGVGPGDRVALLGSTGPDYIGVLFATWALGAIAVPLAIPTRIPDVDRFEADMRRKVTHAGASLLAFDPALGVFGQVRTLGPPTLDFDELRRGATEAPFTEPDPDDPMLIQYTSGATGDPKGVVISHRAMLGNTSAAIERGRFTTDDVTVAWLPLFHDFGLIGCLLWPFLVDHPAVLMAPETFIASPGRWMEAIATHRGTITAAPNFAYGLAGRALRASGETLDLSSVRIAANGAEPIDPRTLGSFADAAAPHGFRREALFPVYGLAEATLGVTTVEPDEGFHVVWADAASLADGRLVEAEPEAEGARPLVSVGTPIRGVDVTIRGSDGSPCPNGEVGEIRVRTEYAMSRYWEDPERTAEVMDDGWIHTGDLGVMTPHGLCITGRTKDMIIVAGRNLYPEDAERTAQQVKGVRRGNAVAFGVQGPKREGIVVVAETRAAGDEAASVAKDVSARVRGALGIRPDRIVLVEAGSLPKTPSGKLQRSRTRELYGSGELKEVAGA